MCNNTRGFWVAERTKWTHVWHSGSWQETDGTFTWGNWRKLHKGAVYQVVGRVKLNYPGKVHSLRAITSRKLFPPRVYRAKEVTWNPKRIIIRKEQPYRAMAFSRGPQPTMTGPLGRSWGDKYPASVSSFGPQIFHLSVSPTGKKKSKTARDEMWKCLLMASIKVSLPEHSAEGESGEQIWRRKKEDDYTAWKVRLHSTWQSKNFISGSTVN